MNIQDWANDNDGSIELTGHLAAVSQRYSSIQNQIRQIGALNNLAEAQERQKQESELLEARQNILYDISASLDEIKRLFDAEPARAYYKFLLLEEFVNPLGLEHRMFPGLEWKNHCDKTVRGINEMRSWCDASLDQKHKQPGMDILARRDQRLKEIGERKKQEEEHLRLESERAAKLAEEKEIFANQKAAKKRLITAKGTLVCSVSGVVVVLVIFAFLHFMPTQNPNRDTLKNVFRLGLLMSLIGASISAGNLAFIKEDELPQIDRPRAKMFLLYSFGLLALCILIAVF